MRRAVCVAASFATTIAWFAQGTDASVRSVRGARCDVTVAGRRTRPPKPVPQSFNYGNAGIAVVLPPGGRVIAGRLASGGEQATINPNGSIRAKFGWWRAIPAKPIIRGRRLGRTGGRISASVPNGYGAGFQATALTFPTTGCWRITGSAGRSQLAFTLLVTKSPLGP